MRPLIIARITTEPDPMHEYRMRWVITLSYPRRPENDPFLTFRTGNADEAQELPYSLAEYCGYSRDEIDVRHLY